MVHDDCGEMAPCPKCEKSTWHTWQFPGDDFVRWICSKCRLATHSSIQYMCEICGDVPVDEEDAECPKCKAEQKQKYEEWLIKNPQGNDDDDMEGEVWKQ